MKKNKPVPLVDGKNSVDILVAAFELVLATCDA
jgi:hypothetical protein